MVIIVSREGQLANRIMHASSFIVNACEHGYQVKHIFFDDYYSFFSESLNKNTAPIRFWGRKKNLWLTIFRSIARFGIRVFLKLKISRLPFFEIINYEGYHQELKPFNLNDENFVRKACSKLVLIHGWLFRDPVNQKKHRELLQETWKPNKVFCDQVNAYYDNYRKEHDLLIGVHIRRGDYQGFEGGKWFFTPDQYFEKMKEVAALRIFRDRKIAFVICSNEMDLFFSHDERFSVYREERHFITDLYLLAKCDYIIGPPSTFSIWASFYGGVPLYMIKDISIPVTDENFSIKAEAF